MNESLRFNQIIVFCYFRQLFRAPLSFLYTFYMKIQRFSPCSFLRIALTYCKSKRNVHQMLFYRYLVRSFFWRRLKPTPIEELENYCTYFNNKYGNTHSTFYRGTLSQVLNLVLFFRVLI